MSVSTDGLTHLLVEHDPGLLCSEPHLRQALHQAATRPGQGLRGSLVQRAAGISDLPAERANQLATAVEYWHHASLIFDDLPCMDDAQTRRGAECLHRTFGDATATLAALALVNRAYALFHQAFLTENAEVRLSAIKLVDGALGAAGILEGQAWDLRFHHGPRHARDVGRVAWRKTGALLWLSVSLPRVSEPSWPSERPHLRALCVYWSLAYQALDDILDLSATTLEAGKSVERDRALSRPNLPIALGLPETIRRVDRYLDLAQGRLRSLQQLGPNWGFLAEWHDLHFSSRVRANRVNS